MSFLRLSFRWLAAVQVAGWGVVLTAQPVADPADPSRELMKALPERSLPGLESLLTQALSDAPTVLIRRWEAEQSVQNARGARAPMLPSARVYASVGQIYEQRDDGGVESTRNLTAVLYNVGISQPVYRWGEYKNNYEVAKLARAISARNVDETRRLLAVDLRRRYFDLVIATGSVDMARKNLAELNRQLVFAKQQVEDGIAPSTASGTVVAQITAAEIAMQRLENDRDTLARNLARLAGVPVEKLPAVVGELPKPGEIDAWVKALSPDAVVAAPSVRLQNADDSVEMEKLRYKVEKTRLKSKLGLSFSVSQDDRSPDNNVLGPKALVTSWNAFATVDWQIFDGFSANAAQRASLARLRANEADYEQTARLEADERRADVSRLQVSWRNLQQAEISLSGARGSVAAVEKDVAAGWVPASDAELTRQMADAALQSTNSARADFYTMLATYFSNRGIDPAMRPTTGGR